MKKIIFFAFLILSVFIINNLVHSIISLWQKQELLVQAEKQLDTEKQKNQQLHTKLQQVSTNQYVEEQARDKLLMVKPGEQVVVLPGAPTPEPALPTPTPTPVAPNPVQWYRYFFGQGK